MIKCDSCTHKEKDAMEYPCNDCIHANGCEDNYEEEK